MARYYCCLNNNDGHTSTGGGNPWSGLPSGTWTRVQYGAGGDLSDDVNNVTTGLKKLRDDLSAEIMADLDTGNRDSRRALCLEGMANWGLATGVYTAHLFAFTPTNDGPMAELSRTDKGGQYGASIDAIDGFNPPVLPDDGGTDEAVTFTKAAYDAAVAKMDVLVSRSIDNTAGGGPWTGTSRRRTLATMQLSDDCMHIMWDTNVPFVGLPSCTSVDGQNHFLIDWYVISGDSYYGLDFFMLYSGGSWTRVNGAVHNFTPQYDTGDTRIPLGVRVHIVRADDRQTVCQMEASLPDTNAPVINSVTNTGSLYDYPTTGNVQGYVASTGSMSGYEYVWWFSAASDGENPEWVGSSGSYQYVWKYDIWNFANANGHGAYTTYGTWWCQIRRVSDEMLIGTATKGNVVTQNGYWWDYT